jgi:UDP-glucose 4-epimerase
VVVLDNLSTGHHVAMDGKAIFVQADMGNEGELNRIFLHIQVRQLCILLLLVGNALKYYENNVRYADSLKNYAKT